MDEETMIGHRKRLMEKFRNNPESFEIVDLLELLLFSINSRKNTRGIARSLMMKYKQIALVANLNVEELCEIDGLGISSALFLKAIFKLCELIMYEKIQKQKLSMEYLVDYIRLLTQDKTFEILYIAFIDIHNRVTSVEEIARGDSACVHINMKYLMKLILNKEPTGIIIIHNHPSGNITPSNHDIQNTKNIKNMLSLFSIALYDSLIVSANGQSYSLADANLI